MQQKTISTKGEPTMTTILDSVRHWTRLLRLGVAVALLGGLGLAQPALADDFKVAMLLPGSINDYGYNLMGKRALEMIAEQTGAEWSQ